MWIDPSADQMAVTRTPKEFEDDASDDDPSSWFRRCLSDSLVDGFLLRSIYASFAHLE